MPTAPPSDFRWRSESDTPRPDRLTTVDDRLRADDALSRVRRGAWLLHTGDFHNAKQLVGAMGRRLRSPPPAPTPIEAFRAERKARALEHETLGHLVVQLDRQYRLKLGRAPDVALACTQVWGPAEDDVTVVSLKTLLGMLGAAEWRKKGLAVPGLKAPLTAHYGVYLPTRTDYVELLSKVSDVAGKTVFDIGTGTGVLAMVLLERKAAFATGTDLEPRAVACATENAQRLGMAARFKVEERALFPEGRADLVVCNPPWVPEPPKNRVDRAVFDEGSAMLVGFLEGLREHLNPGGRGLLLLSDLAVLLGLRPKDWLAEQFARCGLRVLATHSVPAKHGKAKDKEDPLHAVRSAETTSLFVLADGG